MPPVGFEPTISAGERPQTHSLDCAATETGNYVVKKAYSKGSIAMLAYGIKTKYKRSRISS